MPQEPPDFSEVRFEEGLPDFDEDHMDEVDFYSEPAPQADPRAEAHVESAVEARAESPTESQAESQAERGPDPAPTRKPVVASAWRILDLVDFHVTTFGSRPDVLLDLPAATAACSYLLENTRILAATHHMHDAQERTRTFEADPGNRTADLPAGASAWDMAEDFGPKVEDVLTNDGQWLLGIWYEAYLALTGAD